MAMSDYLEEKLIKLVYNGGTFDAQAPTEWWVALFNTDPTDTGGGTELSAGAYARQQFTPTTATGTDWVINNTSDITFPTATSDWATINYMAIYDESSNLLDYGPIDTARTVLTDGIFKILAGELSVKYQ